jgi:hypothetical protein
MNPDGTGAGTGVAFFNTNSTGQLAFLDNMLAIAHVEFSPEGSTLKTWEWKGGTVPLETGGSGGALGTGNPDHPDQCARGSRIKRSIAIAISSITVLNSTLRTN